MLRSLGEYEAELIPVRSPFVNDSVVQELQQAEIKDVEAITGRLVLTATAFEEDKGRLELGVPVVGVPSDETGFGDYLNTDGNEVINLNQGNVLDPPILVGENLAENLGVSAGDSFLIVFAEGDFKVSISQQIDYIYKEEDKGREYYAFAIITRLDILQLLVEPLSGNPNSINSIRINFNDNIDSKEEAEEALSNIEAATDTDVTHYDSTFFYYSNTKYNIKEAIDNLIDSLDQMLTIFGSLIVLAGLLLIVNIQLMSVEEREQQVGILRAVGTQRGQILGTTVIEVLLLGLIGSFLGIIGGILYGLFLVWAFAWTFEFPAQEVLVEYSFLGFPFRGPVVSETIVITSFILGFLIALLTSVLPAWRASRINIVEVMRGVSPPESQGYGRKGLYFGMILIIIGGLWGITSGLEPWSGIGAWGNVDDAEVLYFIILLPVVGIALTASYFLSRRMSLNVMAFALIAWPIFNGFVVTDWLTEGSGGMLWIIGIIMSLIAGSCLLIGVNLDYVALAIRRAAGIVPALKAISLVAMEQMASKKVRSTLVFAIFSVVLTMNIMLAVWSYSYRYGADETVELVAGGTDVIIVADQDVPNSLNFSEQVKNKFTSTHGVNLVRGYTVSPNPTPAFLDKEDTYEDAQFVSIIPIDNKSFWRDGQFNYEGWAFQFSLTSKKADRLETEESVDDTKVETRQENEYVWRFVAENQTIDNKAVAIIPPLVASFTGDLAVEAGESIWLLEKDGVTRREFVAAATDYGNALTNWPTALAAAGPPTLSMVVFLPMAQATELLAFEDGINSQSLFLVEAPDNKLKSKENEELAADIEEWANGADGDFRINHGIYGIAGIPVWDIYEVEFDGMYRFFTFIQIFTSGGFLVGVLGLLVVSMRSVQERKREIGMMRSLGFRKLDVTGAVLFELVLMGLIGLVVGLVNGSIVAYVLVDVNSSGTMDFLIPWGTIGLYTAIILSSAFFAAIIPGWLASRIPPSDALRYTG